MDLNKSIDEACLMLGITGVKSKQREAKASFVKKDTFVCAPPPPHRLWKKMIFQASCFKMNYLNINEVTTDIEIV